MSTYAAILVSQYQLGLRFLYFKPATPGQPENSRKQENFIVILLHFFRGNRVLDQLPSTDAFRAKSSSYFRLLDLTLSMPDQLFFAMRSPTNYSIIITYIYVE